MAVIQPNAISAIDTVHTERCAETVNRISAPRNSGMPKNTSVTRASTESIQPPK